MSLHYRRQGAAIIIFGNTFPYKDQIKALGGRFNGADKNWLVPWSDDNATRIGTLCETTGGGPLTANFSDKFNDLRDLDLMPRGTVSGEACSSEPTAALAAGANEDFSIRQLMDRLHSAVSGVFPTGVWVIGEVQNLAKRASGIFLDLAEPALAGHQNATTTVKAMLWNANLGPIKLRRGEQLVADILQDGLKIRCFCQVTLYKERGTVSLAIEDIDPAYTKGTLALAREQLLKDLRRQGLDRLNKDLRRPAFPLRVGLISAEQSRAKSDFLDQLLSGGFPGIVLFQHAPMQGEAVPRAVSDAIAALAAPDQRCDLIVLTRGGGSAADLRWFDAPEIAYAIASCPIPVIAAIGHHDDVCVAEEICHLRQKTPTAAADFVLACFADTRRRVQALADVLARYLSQRVDEVIAMQAMLSERLANAASLSLGRRRERAAESLARLNLHAERRLAQADAERLSLKNQLELASLRALNHHESRLSLVEKQVAQHDPSAWLKQGWTQIRGTNGLIRVVEDTSVGATLSIRLADGLLKVRVEDLIAKCPKKLVRPDLTTSLPTSRLDHAKN